MWPSSVRSPTQRFELGGRLIELGDNLAVTSPCALQLLDLAWRQPLQPAPGIVVLRLSTLVTSFKSVEPLPKAGVEPFGSLLF